MRTSPTGCCTVPRTPGRRAGEPSCPGPAADHQITPGCLKTVIPGPAFRAPAHALTGRRSPQVPAVAGMLALYRTGERAGLPGTGRRRYASIQNGLHIAGLITREDRNASGKAAQ